uniref:Uncharacterized protein n=1 Tax=Solanum lycopersicum TaxID=4081 RepID=K4BZJ0_SOLLC
MPKVYGLGSKGLEFHRVYDFKNIVFRISYGIGLNVY